MGLAFQNLMGPPSNYSRPFFDLLVESNPNIHNVFALQCCDWSNGYESSAHMVDGSFDVGGVNKANFHLPLLYTPVTERNFWAVDMLDVQVQGVSALPHYRKRNDTIRTEKERQIAIENKDLPEMPQTIVDSGTSNLVFTMDLYDNVLKMIKKAVKTEYSDKIWSGDECLDLKTDLSSFWPNISLVFAGGNVDDPPFALVIPPCRYLSKTAKEDCDNGIDGYSFSIEGGEMDDGNIVGQVAYEVCLVKGS